MGALGRVGSATKSPQPSSSNSYDPEEDVFKAYKDQDRQYKAFKEKFGHSPPRDGVWPYHLPLLSKAQLRSE